MEIRRFSYLNNINDYDDYCEVKFTPIRSIYFDNKCEKSSFALFYKGYNEKRIATWCIKSAREIKSRSS